MLRKTLLAATAVLIAASAWGQAPPTQAPAPSQAAIQDVDASATREELRQLLQRHPSEVGDVLALSPTLITNESYMGSYPALQAFVQAHPEVASNPVYFFGAYGYNHDDRSATMRFWEDFLAVLAAILSGVFASLLVAWLIKTLLEQRRWNALQRVQAEVHQKMLDRLGSNEQLLAYLETPAGRRFLESGPIPVESPRQVSAPIGRVLWSMQAGVVVVFAGLGFMAAAPWVPVGGEAPLRVIGIATLSIGIGFVISSVASFFLSRRLGLLEAQGSERLARGDAS